MITHPIDKTVHQRVFAEKFVEFYREITKSNYRWKLNETYLVFG